MNLYIKKPIVVEAIQWNGINFTDIYEFTNPNNDPNINIARLEERSEIKDYSPFVLKIKTLEGVMTASKGDYIIKGINGEFYPCKPDIFEKTYNIAPTTWKERLEVETIELAVKLNKLNRFLEKKEFYEMDPEDKALLYDQVIFMNRYIQVLEKRCSKHGIKLNYSKWKID